MQLRKSLFFFVSFAVLSGLNLFSIENSKFTSIKLSKVLELSPIEMSKNSLMVQEGFKFLMNTANQISNEKLKKMAIDCLNNPSPTLLELYPTNEKKEEVKQKLVSAGYLKPETTYNQFLPIASDPNKATQPFYSAPGSGYKSHHSYPGGLVTHTAVNLHVSMALFNAYKDVYGFEMDKDIVIAAELLHDIGKPWVFQWQEDGSSLPEAMIAGTGAHHILGIAELIHRGFPAELVVAMACAHNPADNADDEKQIVDWLNVASILNNKDAIKLGLLAPDGKTLPIPRHEEGFITHLGDHDFVLTVPAAQWMINELSDIAKKEYGMNDEDLNGKKFNYFRNYVFSRVSAEYLHEIMVKKGREGLIKFVKSLVTL